MTFKPEVRQEMTASYSGVVHALHFGVGVGGYGVVRLGFPVNLPRDLLHIGVVEGGEDQELAVG